MVHNIDGQQYLTIAETVEFMGCTDGWVRHLLRREEEKPGSGLRGKRLGARLWLINLESAKQQREALTTRANAKRHLAKRPASKRPDAKRKKAAKRRK
jgi:hypothetical protein